MGFFDKLKGELIDIIEYPNQAQDTIVHRFERYNNEIKNNAKLVVREGQMAAFINEGQLADVFTPGTHTLNTQNLPILSTLKGWKYGFDSPFKAEVYFVSTRNFIDQKWGTRNPVILNSKQYGMIELRAFGSFTFKITDAAVFIREIVGTTQTFTTQQITEQLKSIIVTRFSDAVGEANLPIEQYAANLNELSAAIFEFMKDDFASYGIDITRFLIENISMPDEVKKEIFEYSRLGTVDLNKLTQIKIAKSIQTAASNPAGHAGMGMSLGAGMIMAQQMMQTMKQAGAGVTPGSAQTPPPIPTEDTYYVAINGQQSGPYTKEVLSTLAKDQVINQASLVWKKGMAGWEAAGEQNDLQDLWATTPPPLPQ